MPVDAQSLINTTRQIIASVRNILRVMNHSLKQIVPYKETTSHTNREKLLRKPLMGPHITPWWPGVMMLIMTIENNHDLSKLKIIGRIVFETLLLMKRRMEIGMTTLELDAIGAKNLEKYGARSAPILMYDFPGHTCISINEEAAHGIPSEKVIQPGDVVNIDVSAELDGYFGDTGGTFLVPPMDPKIQYLCRSTRKALHQAMDIAKTGARVNRIGASIDRTARRHGFVTLKDLGSHGIGKSLHEDPHFIANFYDRNDHRVLSEGQVITIEPFLSTGSEQTTTEDDGWTLTTGTGNFSAQYEHTMVITKGKPIILTAL